jgi:hypothetical protein
MKKTTKVKGRFDLSRASAGDWLSAIKQAAALGLIDRARGRLGLRTGREIALSVAYQWNVGQEAHLLAAYKAGRYHAEHVALARDERPAHERKVA